MFKRARVFWFHFNKPASRAAGKPKISVHYNKVCHIVDNVVIGVPTRGHINKRQPMFVIMGRAKNFDQVGEVMFIS